MKTGLNITCSADYRQLEAWLGRLPELFERQEGQLLYSGRNEVRLLSTPEGQPVVAKRFKRHDWLKRLVYTFCRENKAQRAYNNARRLRERGFETPREVGCTEVWHCGLLVQVYYVCLPTGAQPIKPRLIEQQPYDEALAESYGRYVARLHERGVLHQDLNPTNVLFTEGETPLTFDFELIDINRMRFFDGAVPQREAMKNLTLFWWLSPVYRRVLQVYAEARGWSHAQVEEAIAVKQRHDRQWVLRKTVTHPLSYRKPKQTNI